MSAPPVLPDPEHCRGARPRRRTVAGFCELRDAQLADGINALCWPRTLQGDFDEVARLLAPPDGLVTVTAAALHALSLSQAGRAAVAQMLDDMRALEELGCDPVLNCITRYAGDDRGLPISTDVMSFHADSAPTQIATWLCTYCGKSSEGLNNAEASRLVDVPAIRDRLLAEYGGTDDDGFAAFLREDAFDMHYRAAPDATPFAFGVGNLWKVAVAWPGCPVPPCLHRAPAYAPGDAPRLLLIA